MTITINNQNVSKAVLNHATEMARTRQTRVVIFGSKTGDEIQHMVVTERTWENCSNKEELTFVTYIDEQGDFVD